MRDSNSRPLGPKPSALAIWANSRNFTSFLEWWAWVDSNHRPHPYQRCALTAWATRPFYIIIYKVVPRGRIELPTQGFSGLCSTTELPWLKKSKWVYTNLKTKCKRKIIFFKPSDKTKQKHTKKSVFSLFFHLFHRQKMTQLY